MNRRLLIGALVLMWAVLMAKTIQAILYHDLSPTAHYYGTMTQLTWQAQFNIDLLIHTLLLAFWMVYRERRRTIGFICGAASIYLGAVFSFGYIILAMIQANGDGVVFFRGRQKAA